MWPAAASASSGNLPIGHVPLWYNRYRYKIIRSSFDIKDITMQQHPVRIDIGISGQRNSSSFFSGFPFEKLKQQRLNQEYATGNERQGLLRADQSTDDGTSCLKQVNRIVPICVCVLCALTTAMIIVFMVLFYTQVADAVNSIDQTVSLKTKTANMIQNVDSILNSTARTVERINRLVEKPTISIG